MISGTVDPLHPDTQRKLYTLHLPAAFLGAGVTLVSATWTGRGGIVIDDEAFANPGEPEHDEDYDGPLCSVWVSTGTARSGSIPVAVLSFSTSSSNEGPLHVEIPIPVTNLGH